MLEKLLQLVSWKAFSSSQDQTKLKHSPTETPEEFRGFNYSLKKTREETKGSARRTSGGSTSSYDNTSSIYVATSSSGDSGSSYSSCDSGSSSSSSSSSCD